MNVVPVVLVTMFPGCPHRQYFPTASISPPPEFDCFQYANTAWEVWSHALTSGRQTVDAQRVVPNCYNTCFALICPWHCEQRMVLIVCLANSLTSNLWTVSTRKSSRFFVGQPPPPPPPPPHVSTWWHHT